MRHVFRFTRKEYRSSTEFFHRQVPASRMAPSKRLLCEILNVGYHLHLRKFRDDKPTDELVWRKYKDMRPLVCTATNGNRFWSDVRDEESIHLCSEGHRGGTALVMFEYYHGGQKYSESRLVIKEWSAVEVVMHPPKSSEELGLLSISKVIYC
jgi:hypothetical protein